MKYIIDSKSKITMKGNKVTPKTGETIYDSSKDVYEIATMREIAQSNGFKVKGKTQADVKKSFNEALIQLKIAKVSTMKITEEVLDIVKEGNKEGTSESNVLIAIVNSGVKFGQALKQLKLARIELGLSISDADRKKKATVIMEDEDFEPETYDDVTKMVKQLADPKEGIPNTNEQQALIQIRKFCKDNNLKIPAKPKGSGVPVAVKLMAWMFANIEEDDSVFEEWLEDQDKSESVVEAWTKKFKQLKAEIAANAPDEKKAPAKKGGKKK